MPHIYSRFCKREKIICVSGNMREGKIFLKMAGVSHGIQPEHRGIATARPYQSSFTVTVHHLSVSKAQLAAELCHVGQNSIGWIFECETAQSPRQGAAHSDVAARGSIIKALSCQYDTIGWFVHSAFVQKGLFLILNAVWVAFCLHISSGIPFNRNQMHYRVLFTMLIYSWNWNKVFLTKEILLSGVITGNTFQLINNVCFERVICIILNFLNVLASRIRREVEWEQQ